MALTSDTADGNMRDGDAVIREQIHAAFDHVALSLSCSLSSLLEETRSRGIRDADVRTVLANDEADVANGIGSDMQLLCYRSNANVHYITRDTASPNAPISTTEAFVRLPAHDKLA